MTLNLDYMSVHPTVMIVVYMHGQIDANQIYTRAQLVIIAHQQMGKSTLSQNTTLLNITQQKVHLKV